MPRYFCFLFLYVITAVFELGAQSPQRFQKEFMALKNVILSNHYNAGKIDDHFSAVVYDKFLDKLDPDQLYFTAEDVKSLSAYKNTFDDEFNNGTLTFLPVLTRVFKKSLERSVHTIEQITSSPFDLDTKEVYTVDTLWAINETANLARWRQILKMELLDGLMETYKNSKNISDADFIKKYEPTVRQKVALAKLRPVKRILDYSPSLDDYVVKTFFHVVTSSFDPHSNYFSPAEIENFLASLSTEGYYYGFSLDENEHGDLVVSQLMPGGPAWRSGVIHAGDVMKEIRLKDKMPVDLTGIEVDEADEILAEAGHDEAEFVFTNAAGEVVSVKLKKEKITDEENIVKSVMLIGERKIGYISLPGFYSDWGQESGSACANDVAKEIVKLKKENIEGIILDIRFNGGGSLNEAVAMAGIFIDAGPVGILKTKTGEAISYKDMNRGTIYDGPLIIMVNSMSASASEFLAAALQDYHRAIIVGSQTFGKATAQTVLPLETGPKGSSSQTGKKSDLGFASITENKIYRITGKTVQQFGVRPDVALPDVLSHLKFKERDIPGVLAADSVQKKVYYQPYPLLPLKELNQRSHKRTSANSDLQFINQYSIWLSKRREAKSIPLNWSNFKTDVIREDLQLQKMQTFGSKTKTFTLKEHESDEKREKMNEYVETLSKTWHEKIEHDVVLEEAFNIICDYILLKDQK